jgi:hypothetical protein
VLWQIAFGNADRLARPPRRGSCAGSNEEAEGDGLKGFPRRGGTVGFHDKSDCVSAADCADELPLCTQPYARV